MVDQCARKIWITYVHAYLPYESWEDSSNQLDGPMGSLDAPLTPWDPLAPPRTPKQVSWPNRLFRSPQRYYKSPEDPSKANPLTVWDCESESKTNSRTFLGQFVLVKNQIPPPLWFQKYYPSCKCIQKKRAFGPSWQYRYSSIIVQVVTFPLTYKNNTTENNVENL